MSDLHLSIVQLRLPHALTAAILAIAIGLFLVLTLYAVRMHGSYLLPSLPALMAAAVSAWRLQQHPRQTRYRLWRLTSLYERSVRRVKGDWAGSGVTGEEFSDATHVFAKDLHIFGEGSLFELLCTVRTAIGQRGLANYLLKAPPARRNAFLRQASCSGIASIERRVREQIAPARALLSFSQSKRGPSKLGSELAALFVFSDFFV